MGPFDSVYVRTSMTSMISMMMAQQQRGWDQMTGASETISHQQGRIQFRRKISLIQESIYIIGRGV